MDQFGAGKRDVFGGDGRVVGAGADRGFGGKGIVAEFAIDVAWGFLRHAARWPSGGDGFSSKAFSLPFAVGGFEKIDEIFVMDFQDGFEAEFGWFDDGSEFLLVDAAEDEFGAFGTFEGRDEIAAVKFGFGVSQKMLVGIDGFHC